MFISALQLLAKKTELAHLENTSQACGSSSSSLSSRSSPSPSPSHLGSTYCAGVDGTVPVLDRGLLLQHAGGADAHLRLSPHPTRRPRPSPQPPGLASYSGGRSSGCVHIVRLSCTPGRGIALPHGIFTLHQDMLKRLRNVGMTQKR